MASDVPVRAEERNAELTVVNGVSADGVGAALAEQGAPPVRPGETHPGLGAGIQPTFGLVGAPLTLIDALVESSDATDLTIVSNNIGEPGRGLGKLLRQGRIRRGISSYFTSNPEAVRCPHSSEQLPCSGRQAWFSSLPLRDSQSPPFRPT